MSDYYLQQVKDSVEDTIYEYLSPDCIEPEELSEMDRYDIEEYLDEQMWDDDSVTGNGSGSYTYDREKAKKHVLADGFDTVVEAIDEGLYDKAAFADHIIGGDWETIDVIARCTVLRQAISEFLDEHPEIVPKTE